MTPTPLPPPVSNSFTRMLGEIRHGAPLADLSAALQSCVAAVKEKGKPAQIRYTLKLTPQGNAVIVTDDVEVKLPKEDRKGAVFFPTEENTLSRDNPQQMPLELRTVEKVAVELKEAQGAQTVA